jgi:type II secretory pathway pseudopilin PulG
MDTSLSGKFSSSIQAFTAKQRERKGGPVRRSLGVGGFTLLELLVVITIIIILIGFLFPAFRGIQDQAKRTQAKNDLNQIITAISAFYTEYGYYPVPTGTSTTADINYPARGQYQDAGNSNVFNILRYDTNNGGATVSQVNPRQVVFIEPPISKDQTNPKLGIRFVGGCWFDPWGYAYNVTIDTDYNSVTTAPVYTDLSQTYNTAGSDKGPSVGVIAWTMGADGQLGNNGDNAYKDPSTGIQSDDVISWQ